MLERPPAAALTNFLKFLLQSHIILKILLCATNGKLECGGMGGLKLYIFFFFIFSSDFEHIIVRDLLRLRLCQAKVRPSPSWFLCKKFIPSDCDAL